jgi:hypothetical protein
VWSLVLSNGKGPYGKKISEERDEVRLHSEITHALCLILHQDINLKLRE